MSYTSTINWSGVNTPTQLFAAAGAATDMFWTGITWLIFLVVLTVSMNFGFEVAFLIAGFLGLIISMFLFYMGLVSFAMTLGPFIAIIILFFIIIAANNRSQG